MKNKPEAGKNKLGMRSSIVIEGPDTAGCQKGCQASPTDHTAAVVGLLGGLVGKIRLTPYECQSARGFLD